MGHSMVQCSVRQPPWPSVLAAAHASPLYSGLGLQLLDRVLNGSYGQPHIIPTKSCDLFNLEQLNSELFTHRVS